MAEQTAYDTYALAVEGLTKRHGSGAGAVAALVVVVVAGMHVWRKRVMEP